MQIPKGLNQVHDRLQTDFPFFARHALRIKHKRGSTDPFVLNRSQQFLHDRLERQKAEMGWVRALVVKGRQQGCSTYIGGRFFHKATRKVGQSVFILSHQAETTKKLFRIVERFYEHTPGPLRPEHRIANRREFIFEGLDSEYTVGTAGSKDVGRGGTIQLFHGSEAAFWENTDDIQTGILQSVALEPGTESILESTGNGMGNMFYDMCMAAVAGDSHYMVVFIPWYWQEEYTLDRPHNDKTELSKEEKTYQATYGLTTGQMYWRRAKIAEFKSDWKFKQEYPANLMEAFQTSGDTFIDPANIMAARASKVEAPDSPLIIGLDPGRNRDRTVFAYRRGRQMLEHESFKFAGEDNERVQMKIAALTAHRIDSLHPQKVFIDVGHGYGVIDRLHELGYKSVVQGVGFGESAIDDQIYANKRAEMWCLLRDWLAQEDGEVSIPDQDVIHRDLVCVPTELRTTNNRIQLEGKKKIRKLSGFSPDIGDAYALTFAYPLAPAGPRRTPIVRKSATARPVRVSHTRRQSPRMGRATGLIHSARG